MDDVVSRNRQQQADWYGEALGDTVQRLTAVLGLTQGQLASVVGLSAPMLSQLASGQRAKIANPSVLARFQALAELAASPGLQERRADEVAREVERVRSLDANAFTTGTRPVEAAAGVGRVLREAASPAEIARAAALLDAEHPGLARVLRVHGLGEVPGAEQDRTTPR